MLTHSSEKPHQCSHCGRSYCDARSLRRHFDKSHVPGGSLPSGAAAVFAAGVPAASVEAGMTMQELPDNGEHLQVPAYG